MDKLFKTIDKDKVLQRKDLLESKKEKTQKQGSLYKFRIALEDNISTKGIKTQLGSKMLEDYIPPFNASVVESLEAEGGLIVGKVDTKDFGLGGSLDSQLGQVVKLGFADASLGIDSSGEIRILAGKSNLYGLKPTYGSISRYGLIGSAPSFDQLGIISKEVSKIRDIFQGISGKDEKDSTSLDAKKMDLPKLKDIKLGLIKEYYEELDPYFKGKMDKTLQGFKDLGCTIDLVSISSSKYSASVYNVLQSAEFASNMGKFDGVLYGHRTETYKDTEDFYRKNRTEGFSEEVKKRLVFGNFVLSKANYQTYYEKSQRIRTMIVEEVRASFTDYHILISPILKEDTKSTLLANVVGLPAMSIPSLGKDKYLSIGLMADSFGEEVLFNLCESLEENILAKEEER